MKFQRKPMIRLKFTNSYTYNMFCSTIAWPRYRSSPIIGGNFILGKLEVELTDYNTKNERHQIAEKAQVLYGAKVEHI